VEESGGRTDVLEGKGRVDRESGPTRCNVRKRFASILPATMGEPTGSTIGPSDAPYRRTARQQRHPIGTSTLPLMSRASATAPTRASSSALWSGDMVIVEL
jgi:hypothetical protein